MRKFSIRTVIAAVLIMCISVTASLAYFTDYAEISGVKEICLDAKTETTEEFEDLSKLITVKNTGEVSVFVRLSIAAPNPEYTTGIESINFEASENWVKEGDFWYYTKALAPGDSADIFKVLVTGDENVADADFDITVVTSYVQAAFVNNVADRALSWSLAINEEVA